MDEIFKVIRRKGSEVLLHGGYQYYRQKTYMNGSTIWHCSNKKHRSLKCTGSITENGKIVKKVSHENKCTKDEPKNKVAVTIDKTKEETSLSEEAMPRIFKKNIDPLLNEGLNFVTEVPTFENTKCVLYSQRKRELQVSKLVYNDIRDVEVPSKFRIFLLADYNTEETRIIVFSTKNDLLPAINEYFVDATFKSTPKPFYQFLVIHGDVGSTIATTKVVPLFFALMSNKTESSYFALFDVIKTRASQWNPKKIHVDFEIATTNALKNIFPGSIIKRCYFHYKQTIYRTYKKLNLRGKMYQRIVDLCSVLPLLPYDKIEDGYTFIKLKSLQLENTKIDKFMEYMETYFF